MVIGGGAGGVAAYGTKRTSRHAQSMSAFGDKADIQAMLLTKDEARRIAAPSCLAIEGKRGLGTEQ